LRRNTWQLWEWRSIPWSFTLTEAPSGSYLCIFFLVRLSRNEFLFKCSPKFCLAFVHLILIYLDSTCGTLLVRRSLAVCVTAIISRYTQSALSKGFFFLFFKTVLASVADPGCFYRIPDMNFSLPDPESA
jgi:hypothetical protein